MNHPLVSVIVPIYSVEQFLPKCIDSILCQTYNNLEVILIDDESPDRCPVLCDHYSHIDQRVIVIHKKNGRVAAARNTGIRCASGTFSIFVDGDDYLHECCIQRLVEIQEKYNADIVQCCFEKGNKDVFPITHKKRLLSNISGKEILLSNSAKVVVWGKLYRTEILKSNPMVEKVYFEDDYSTWKWYNQANIVTITTEKLYYYRENELSIMSCHKKNPNLDFIDAYKQRISYFESTGENYQVEYSYLLLCKSLILNYNPKIMTAAQIAQCHTISKKCFMRIKKSSVINWKYKCIIGLFVLLPKFIFKVIK